MCKKILNQAIQLKEYISEKEFTEISELEMLCSSEDKTNLKLELDYRLNMSKRSEGILKNINEFLYYIDGILVAYIGISSFGANIGEINGMVHPDFRRKGLFKKLFKLAMEECENRNFNKVLLLTDGKSTSGIEFIKSISGIYDFSEYRMKQVKKTSLESIDSVTLRKAEKLDRKEIGRQNSIFFNDIEENQVFQEYEENPNEITYILELDREIIGKIRVEYSENSAFIYGFGILPAFRGKGYGKAALRQTLHLINEKSINEVELDVECKNNTALNLYKSCGFEERSVMDYYKYSTKI
jgi:ribosomal protein S18 acetylase RimI-like enzyme